MAVVLLAVLAPGVSLALKSLRIQAEPWTEICSGSADGSKASHGLPAGHDAHGGPGCAFCCTPLDPTPLAPRGVVFRVAAAEEQVWRVARAAALPVLQGAWPAARSRAPPGVR